MSIAKRKRGAYKVQAPQDISLDLGIETESLVTDGFDGASLGMLAGIIRQ